MGCLNAPTILAGILFSANGLEKGPKGWVNAPTILIRDSFLAPLARKGPERVGLQIVQNPSRRR
ncbi:hypothetical protein SAMN04490243_0761 [Robiginitalea myxolifaciens]|uniref:Uncharacterized protein n=1 Tax=Robiginitalea myxolifaciens TaxID=400055 RepID=A0A1I6FVM2_9FLAO|nr:hypothetical protein SAMN04490243_0761 [Robiginitalea myxolifaciens]